MCEFASWVEKDNKVYFLTNHQVFHTAKGKRLREYNGNLDYIHGHGAIRAYYNLKDGKDKECTDFSGPDNFPKEIIMAIKADKMRWGTPTGLLLPEINAQWKAEWDAVYAKWRAERDAVYTKWDAERDAVYAKWDAERDAVNAHFWDLFAIPENRNPVWR